jgi:hypothetical protein
VSKAKKSLLFFILRTPAWEDSILATLRQVSRAKKLAFLFDFLENTLYTEFENGFQIIELWQEFIIQNNVN